MLIVDRSRWTRRSLLAGIGSAALLPFVPRLQADTDDDARRLVLFFSPNGTLYETWRPSSDLVMGPILEPLAPHAAKLNVIDGIRLNWSGPAGQHLLGMAGLWTGCALGGDLWAQGPSIDQVLAQRLEAPTPFASLELGVRTGGANEPTKRYMIYAAGSEPVPAEDDPVALWDRLFAAVSGDDDTGADAMRQQRQSIIDLAKSDLDRLSTRIGTDDRHKLDAHLDALRAIELRLSGLDSIQCAPPDAPAPATEFPEILALQTDLLVAALACDLTRIASLQCSYAQSFEVYTFLGLSDRHHAISHFDHADAGVQEQVTTINRWYAEQFERLVAGLDAISEGDRTLLDNCLVIWGNEMAKGQGHTPWPTPFVTAGSAGGKIATGRLLDTGETAHQRLLVSIAHTFGAEDITSFGDLDPGSGPLSGW